LKALYAVLWREYIYFIRRIKTITLSSLISPTLYIIAFGFGLGKFIDIENIRYIDFLIPGILAINTMNVSFNAIATPLTIARIHDKTLEEYITAPITAFSFTLGKITAGALRGLYSSLIIIIFSIIIGVKINISVLFIILIILNCYVFSSLGFLISMIIKSHLDMARFRNFTITPMIFVCGTFFSLEKLPVFIKFMLKLLPLTPASYGIRALSLGWNFPLWMTLVQVFYLGIFFLLGLIFYSKA
jgi:ABC-type polysaccharide/polyol phosphate export permease